MNPMNSRAGKTQPQRAGYLAFVPAPLNPPPAIEVDAEMLSLASQASSALGLLSGISHYLPHSREALAMYAIKEAIWSSRIEGIACTIEDSLLRKATRATLRSTDTDIEAVASCTAAARQGIQMTRKLPLSLRLLRETHAILMQGAHGAGKTPGEFRRSQNWIGSRGCDLASASFVPPPAAEMTAALADLELFMQARETFPPVIQCAIVHAQFETIHPFLDGNGRLGRILVSLFLHEHEVLAHPTLYLSRFLAQNRREYYDHLSAVREHGAWEDWIKFFLRGLTSTAEHATQTATKLIALDVNLVIRALKANKNETALIDRLFKAPIFDIRTAAQWLGLSYVTVASALQRLEQDGLVSEMTGKRRNKLFRFSAFLDVFETTEEGG